MTYPPDLTRPQEKTVTAQVAAQAIADLVPLRRVVVQAGGCAGLWPLALAHYFDKVFTFEPAPQNFACLRANIAAAPNVVAARCALGDRCASVGLARDKAQAGLWRVEGEGAVAMVPLDDVLGDTPVDALVLDIEGSEVQALCGAARLIATHRPVLWFEFLHHTTAIEDFLRAHDYTAPLTGIGGDCFSVHTSRLQ